MSSTVKNISIHYDAINEHNTFSNGDIISGRVILELSKEAKINSLSVKAKGKAEVRWTEGHGDKSETYYSKEKCFKLEQFILKKRKGDGDGHQSMLMDECGETYSTVISAGSHVYPFTFQIPQGNMPSSFKGIHGKVIYWLEAKLDRSMRLDSKTVSEFNFASNADMSNPQIMSPQIGTKSKKMKLFTSGNASMNVRTERMGYMQGEAITITADIENNTSRALVTKFSVEQKQSFFARPGRRVHTKHILKEEAAPVPSSTRQTITKVLKLPPDLATSINNCPIIKVEYSLKVYLDVPYATDPERTDYDEMEVISSD
ncbi:hypothetical protein AAFF_G00024470 [Aldrovandia affinis]|uniref:Arrestin C-terminal-like domain-containing protein n=1 Tax=Aldrovandia affinis TaxID=143900 RepID=A0AAD7T5R7_9TELE|nr:hypothetical protein AAFF_G00024470 [Aldrovandia affinis]